MNNNSQSFQTIFKQISYLVIVLLISLIFRLSLKTVPPPIFVLSHGSKGMDILSKTEGANLELIRSSFAEPELIEYPSTGDPEKLNCPKCNFDAGKVYSSEKDLILIYTEKWDDFNTELITSLRTSGCQADIFIISTAKLYPFKPTECNVKYYYVEVIGEEAKIRHRLSYQKFRWEVIYHVLSTTELNKVYERVFFFEDQSIVFSDPFQVFEINNLDKTNHILYFFKTHDQVYSSPLYNSIQCHLNSIFFDDVSLPYDSAVLDNFSTFATSIAGGYTEFYRLIQAMLTSPAWPDCYSGDNDKGMLIVAYYFYLQKKQVIPYNILSCESGYYTLDNCAQRFSQVNHILNGIEDKENPSNSLPPAIFLHSGLNYPSLNHYVDNNCPPKMRISELQ